MITGSRDDGVGRRHLRAADGLSLRRLRGGLKASERPPRRLILRSMADGWVLLGPEGQVVFRGAGLPGRQRCLEFARDHGVISVVS